MTDYIIQIKVKNGPMLRAMRRKNINTAAELSRATGISQGDIGKYLNLKKSALTKTGDWTSQIVKISETLNTMPEDLFPRHHIETPLRKNTAEVSLDMADMAVFLNKTPDQLVIEHDMLDITDELLSGLSCRDQRIIKQRFGIKCTKKTLSEIGEQESITGNRVRQLQNRALEKMKKKAKHKQLGCPALVSDSS